MTSQYDNRSNQFPVDIIYWGRRFQSANAYRIGPGDIHVDIAGVTLPIDTKVEISFQREGQEWRIPAIVANVINTKVNLTFLEPQPVLYHKYKPYVKA